MTWKSVETIGTFLRRIGAGRRSSSSRPARSPGPLRGEINRVLNAESANLQRAVPAAARQIAAIERLEADGRLAEQPKIVRLAASARRATPEATLAELARRLELHRSTVQRALERIERLAAEREPARSGMIPAMRPVIIAANWKMHTTPGDAAALATLLAARTDVPGVERLICPPFVCLAAVRDALWPRPPASGWVPRTSITSSVAPTPARSARRCWPAWPGG